MIRLGYVTPPARARGALLLLSCLALTTFASPPRAQAQTQSSATLRGRVTDREGTAVAGAHVRAADRAADRAPRREHHVVTGADGRFELRLPPGTWRVIVTATGFLETRLEVALSDAGAAQQVVLTRAPQALPVVSVVGSTRAERLGVPGAAVVIERERLHGRAPLSVMDALRTVPGVHTADEDPFGLNLNVGLRGLPPRRSARTLLLEDGVPILLGPYGDPSMHYAPPVEALERVELIKGSSQVMNGPQTVGGVVNFVTRPPPTDGWEGETTIGGGALGYRNAHLGLGAGRGGMGAAIDYSYREGSGVRREHEHRFHNVVVKGMLPLGSSQSLLLKATTWDEASRISETGLTQAEFETDPYSLPFSAAGTFDVRRYSAQVVHDARIGRARVRTNAYVSDVHRASWRQSGESGERLGEEDYAEDFGCVPEATTYDQCGNQGRPRDYTILAIEPRLTVDVGGPRSGATFDGGLRLYGEHVRRKQYLGRTPLSRASDAELTRDNVVDTRVIAGFAQARIRLGDATISPALRLEHVEHDIANRFPGREAAHEQSYMRWLPGLGATHAFGERATLFAGVHRGFAPPRPADLYRPEPGQPLVLVEPETSWNWEAGSRLAPVDGVAVEATLFRIDFRNQVVEAGPAAGQRFVNAGRTLHQGLELGARASLGTIAGMRDDLALAVAYTHLPTARFLDDGTRAESVHGNRLPYAPRHLLSGSASFAHRSGVTLGGAVEHTSTQFADDENTVMPSADGQAGVLPAYTVVNAFGSFAIPRTRAQLRASVRNVFDRVYITQRNEGIYTGMRRTARAEVHWAF